jgi:hypothetical protein
MRARTRSETVECGDSSPLCQARPGTSVCSERLRTGRNRHGRDWYRPQKRRSAFASSFASTVHPPPPLRRTMQVAALQNAEITRPVFGSFAFVRGHGRCRPLRGLATRFRNPFPSPHENTIPRCSRHAAVCLRVGAARARAVPARCRPRNPRRGPARGDLNHEPHAPSTSRKSKQEGKRHEHQT